MDDSGRVPVLLREVFRRGTVSVHTLAREAGVDRSTVYRWRDGTRTPSPEGLRALAGALDRKGAELQELAARLRALAGEE